MEAVEVRRHSIVQRNTNCLTKSYAINAFVMSYHVYKKNWTPSIGDELRGFTEPANKLDKYAAPVKDKRCNRPSPTWQVKKICKYSFLFFEV